MLLSHIAVFIAVFIAGASFGVVVAASLRGLARQNGEYDRALLTDRHPNTPQEGATP